jgi:hypothetical protein
MSMQKRIAVAAERASAYGRSFIRGVAETAERHPEWDLALIDPLSIAAKAREPFDGWICRIADNQTASALAKSGRPVVDCLCGSDFPGFASVKTDSDAIGRLRRGRRSDLLHVLDAANFEH